eukprot:scaffold16267_cov93-Isochrysis_galbana.AAC.1
MDIDVHMKERRGGRSAVSARRSRLWNGEGENIGQPRAAQQGWRCQRPVGSHGSPDLGVLAHRPAGLERCCRCGR